MISLTVQHNLDDLNITFKRYALLYSKGSQAALFHAAHNFGVYGPRRLKTIAPPKGTIRSSNIARLKGHGGGMKISDEARRIMYRNFGVVTTVGGRQMIMGNTAKRAKGLTKGQAAQIEHMMKTAAVKGGTIQALLVDQELKLRERARHSLAAAVTFKNAGLAPISYALSRSGRQLGQAKHDKGAGEDQESYVFTWGSSISKQSASVTAGLSLPKSQAQIAEAVSDVRKDMLEYIKRKEQEAARNAARTLR